MEERCAVIIGVSDRSLLWRDGKLNEKQYESFVQEYATFLAGRFDNVIVTPDDGVYTDVAQAFRKEKGVKPIAFYPDKDEYYGYEHLKKNFDQYDARPIGGDWYTLDAELTKQAPVVIALGFSPGVLIEGAFIKYHQKYGGRKDDALGGIRWLVDERCVSQRLPRAFEEQIEGIEYFSSLTELGKLLDK